MGVHEYLGMSMYVFNVCTVYAKHCRCFLKYMDCLDVSLCVHRGYVSAVTGRLVRAHFEVLLLLPSSRPFFTGRSHF